MKPKKPSAQNHSPENLQDPGISAADVVLFCMIIFIAFLALFAIHDLGCKICTGHSFFSHFVR